MYKKKKILAIIAARSGSKSIKDKNLSLINKKPLLYWIIKKALLSKYLDKVFVSTDSKKYKNLSVKYGAECPILRPKKISKDNSTEVDYILHTLNYFSKNENFKPDYIVRLQPTSPLQTISDIDNSIIRIVSDPSASSIQVISAAYKNPIKALKKYNKKYLKPYHGKKINNVINKQKLVKAFYRSNIIVSKTQNVIKNKCQIGKKSLYYEIPEERSIDIDSIYDLEISRVMNKKLKINKI
tara:strand:+ start:461 stop:1180 length:720 start_codon:yes stop_codon:yes gene_type:complete